MPNVELDNAALPQDTAIIARVIISKKHFWTHAVDEAGKIIYHFPSTLGAGYDPSPTGDYRVTYVARDPTFRYQPKLFAEVPDDEPEARLPPPARTHLSGAYGCRYPSRTTEFTALRRLRLSATPTRTAAYGLRTGTRCGSPTWWTQALPYSSSKAIRSNARGPDLEYQISS